MSKTALLLKELKDEIDYKLTNGDLPLAFDDKLLTVKRSGNYFIFTYYSASYRADSTRKHKYEVDLNPMLIAEIAQSNKDLAFALRKQDVKLNVFVVLIQHLLAKNNMASGAIRKLI